MYVNVHAQTIFGQFQLKLETLAIYCKELDLSFSNCLPWEELQVLENFYIKDMVWEARKPSSAPLGLVWKAWEMLLLQL